MKIWKHKKNIIKYSYIYFIAFDKRDAFSKIEDLKL